MMLQISPHDDARREDRGARRGPRRHGDPGRRSASAALVGALTFGLILSLPDATEARQETAYMLRMPTGVATYQLISCPVVPAPSSSSVDPIDAALLGTTGVLAHGLAATPDGGRLLSVDGARDVLVELDRHTGAAVDVIALDRGAGPLASLAFDSDDQLWLMDDVDLCRVDRDTGSVVPVVQTDRMVEAFAIHGGRFIGGEGAELFEIDPSSGATTVLASYQGPYWYCWIVALASDGVDLLGALPCSGSPPSPQSQPYPLVRFDLASGGYEVAAWIASSDSDQYPTAMTLLGSVAAVPELLPAGAVVLASVIASLAVLAIRNRTL